MNEMGSKYKRLVYEDEVLVRHFKQDGIQARALACLNRILMKPNRIHEQS
jgi:hypothetical protein